jgi:hypothetical protein
MLMVSYSQYEIWGPIKDDYCDYSLLGSDFMWSGVQIPVFQRNMLLPSWDRVNEFSFSLKMEATDSSKILYLCTRWHSIPSQATAVVMLF